MTESTVRIQNYYPIITTLVAGIQHDMQLERSIYKALLIMRISLTDKSHLVNLFNNSIPNNVKEQSSIDGPDSFKNLKF